MQKIRPIQHQKAQPFRIIWDQPAVRVARERARVRAGWPEFFRVRCVFERAINFHARMLECFYIFKLFKNLGTVILVEKDTEIKRKVLLFRTVK